MAAILTDPAPMTPQEYCQEKTASSGSSFYYSFLFLPDETRRAITALYAFCREVDDVVDECADPAVAEKTLDWWRGEVERAYAGAADHPVLQEIQRLIEPNQLPKQHFLAIIDGMAMDLHQNRYANFDALYEYCYRAASVVGLLAARLFGYEDPQTETYAHDLGMAFQLTNIIRDVREDALRDRIYLPQDMLQRYGISEGTLKDSQTPPELRQLLGELADRAEGYYQSAMAALPNAERWNQRSGVIMSAIYHALLLRLRQRDFDVLPGRISIPALKKLWLAWRTARRESRQHKQSLKYAV